MASREGKDGNEASIGDLFGRLADDGRAFVKAEADLYKAIALRRAGKAQNGLIAMALALMLAEAAVVVLLVGIALALARQIGPLLAGIVTAVAALLVAYLLVRFGMERMKALGGDAEEKAALAEPEARK